ncbi:hypothetical protein CGX12_09185 [Zobellella denitrificans]|uniref:histidine kinase n=1 Tax=Zobellella denitrificans TaxID=347534 RepID=A0A231MYY3_9GAMM|nr:DUF4118 domain-containing protein [Zobellella denitrificans]ATG76025.1 hypothetical protein AN401_17370 [Zobellella denitrificans]OXS15424.1 hypothetical protein CGX12_09185 [Zobellella denitrificans]
MPWDNPRLPPWLVSLGGPLLAVLLLLPLRGWLTTTDIAMALLLVVAVIAVRQGSRRASLATVLSVLLFDVLFVEPYYTLHVHNLDYLLTFAVMLAVGLLISRLSGQLRGRLERVRQLLRQLRGMFLLARGLPGHGRPEAMYEFVTQLLGRRLGSPVSIHPEPPAEGEALPVFDKQRLVAYLCCATGPYKANRTLLRVAASLLGQSLTRGRLARAEQEARLEAELASGRNALLRSLSHDLRTPLASIMGNASMLADPQVRLGEAEYREIAEAIYQQSRVLSSHFDKVMELNRVQRQEQPSLQVVMPEEVVSAALRRRGNLFDEVRFDFTIDDDTPVQGDATLLEIALANMLENAVRHGQAPFRLEGHWHGELYAFTLSNGCGGRAVRLQRDGGAGLGVPICRAVADLHQGAFYLTESDDGHTMTARLVWPAWRKAA